jgi:hypothetical protein
MPPAELFCFGRSQVEARSNACRIQKIADHRRSDAATKLIVCPLFTGWNPCGNLPYLGR